MKNIFLFYIGISLTLSLGFSPGENWKNKVDPVLLEELKKKEVTEMLVVLQQQADLEGNLSFRDKVRRGRFVFEKLRQTAKRSQSGVLRLLSDAGVPFRPFSVVNAVWTKGDVELLRRIVLRPEVARVEANPSYTFHRPTAAEDQLRLRDGIEWGIRQIGADQVWNRGVRGAGVVVAGADTGYEWQHPALSKQYRGNADGAIDHHYNWHDAIHMINPIHNDSIVTPDLNPCGLDSRTPCDDNGHGTHTMGTMVGDDGMGNQIGVAPEASWIACRNMERGFGSPATYIECFEWFLAPTDLDGNNPDPARAPHVVNNSWGCPPFEGCNPGNFGTMERVVENLEAAGIVVVASAGNSGFKCSTVDDPAAIFGETFTVGAIKPNDSIATFSSRGPVVVDSSFRMKPNITAPGVSVRSALPDSAYASFNGTSMAGPHVAGVVALMISANPELAGRVALIKQIIQETAVPVADTVTCGNVAAGIVPNNTYGYGRIDALAAVERATELTNIDPAAGEVRLSLFPNPADESAWLRVEGLNGNFQLELYDAAGRRLMVRKLRINNEYQEEDINLERLAPGIYFYHLRGVENQWSGSIVVK